MQQIGRHVKNQSHRARLEQISRDPSEYNLENIELISPNPLSFSEWFFAEKNFIVDQNLNKL